MKKTIVLLMIITIISKVIGFSRDMVLAYFYGTSNISDAYLISLTIPVVIFSFIGAGITTAYIPIYNSIEKKEGENQAFHYTSNLINLVLLFCTLIFLFSFIYTDKLVGLFASGFATETHILAVQFTRVTMMGIYFTSLVYILQGFLQVKGKFFIPALIGLPLNLFFLLSIILSKTTNLHVLSIGSVVATASQLTLLIPLVIKTGFKHKFKLDITDANLIEMGKIALPVIIGVSVNEINVLVDRTLASRISVGGISSLTYANRLNGFIVSIFVMSIATVVYPKISKMAAYSDLLGLKRTISKAINGVSLILVPATIGAMLFSNQIIQLLYGRGAFSDAAISMTSGALFFYSLGMLGYSYREIIAKGFYSLKDTKTPVKNSSYGMLINIALNIILSKIMGISGLALATSISSTSTCAFLFISLRKKIGPFGMKQISISFLKILFASLVMGGLAKLSFNYLAASISQNLSLLLAIGVGAVSYFVIIYFMKIEDVDVIVGAIKKKLGRGAV
jgi:putative peptidoglycan lipid II flippase